jgi:hypothetical protein
MTMPNFLILGAAKSGTTALYAYLKQHPDIYMSAVKEPRFFAFENETLNFKGPKGHGDRFNQETITDLKTYQSLFDDVNGEKAIGEASPAYLSSAEKASERIKYYIPDAKLIAILRQPAERAYSAFLHTVRSGRETNLNFESVLALEEKRTKDGWGAIWQHKKLGFYYEQLLPYYQQFSKEQLKVYLYDDLEDDASTLVKDILAFLEVDEHFIPDVSQRVNVSGIPRSQWVQDFFRSPDNALRDFLKPLIPGAIRKPLAKKVKSGNLLRPEIPKDVRNRLTEDYREDIQKLQDLIDRDLTSWLED